MLRYLPSIWLWPFELISWERGRVWLPSLYHRRRCRRLEVEVLNGVSLRVPSKSCCKACTRAWLSLVIKTCRCFDCCCGLLLLVVVGVVVDVVGSCCFGGELHLGVVWFPLGFPGDGDLGWKVQSDPRSMIWFEDITCCCFQLVWNEHTIAFV